MRDTVSSSQPLVYRSRNPAKVQVKTRDLQGMHHFCSWLLLLFSVLWPLRAQGCLVIFGSDLGKFASMSLRLNTTGNVLLRNVGTKGAEAVDTTASIAAKRKFGDTTYSIRATESTIQNIRALNGAVVQLSKPLGALQLFQTMLHTALYRQCASQWFPSSRGPGKPPPAFSLVA